MIVSFSVLVFIASAQMRHLPDVKHCPRSWDTSVNKRDTSPPRVPLLGQSGKTFLRQGRFQGVGASDVMKSIPRIGNGKANCAESEDMR